MSPLVLCPGCNRHVKSDEAVCPFCQAALTARTCSGRCFGPPDVRLGRVALVAAGALLGVACQSTTKVFPPYGTPPHVDAGGQTDGSPDSGDASK